MSNQTPEPRDLNVPEQQAPRSAPPRIFEDVPNGFRMSLVRGAPQEHVGLDGHAYHGSVDLHGRYDMVLPDTFTEGAPYVVVTIVRQA